mmetsp:Transcript_42005/g.64323  ORF Transcript_42005/g.64323 Transcript_42005/m.64323 type:complete len:206 (+) Transcript_42005:676-1293(+)
MKLTLKMKAMTSKKPQFVDLTASKQSGVNLTMKKKRDAMKNRLRGTLDIMTFDQSSKADGDNRQTSVFQLESQQSEDRPNQYENSLKIPEKKRQAAISGYSCGGCSDFGDAMDFDEFAEKYNELENIGEGGAAVVKRIENIASKEIFACKVMRKYDIEKEMSSRAEFELMKSIPVHPVIVQAHEFIATPRWTYLVMELFKGEELQ